ncbi:hypothetical protein [uncultured Traorella sp.]|uniref:hypothetical protein n=1 Tax=uncultured Traorella sp. TaxID=1929048 RepID=UPI0025E8FAC3|nr:hypothetical protein [uncultured Traorella sp.]
MKRKTIIIISSLIFILTITGCEEETLEVRETKRGYTIEEKGIFPWGDGGYTYCIKDDIFFLTGDDQNDHYYRYEMSLETEEFRERVTEIKDNQENNVHQCINSKYGCIYVDNEYIMNENKESIGEKITYYIQEDKNKNILYNETYYYGENMFRSNMSYSEEDEKLYLLEGKETEVIFYERVDDSWLEIKRLPYQQDQYQLEYCSIDNGLNAIYSSDEYTRLVLGEEEYVIEADDLYWISDDFILVETINERYLPETTYLIDRTTQRKYDLNRIIKLDQIKPMSKTTFIYPEMVGYISTYNIAVISGMKMNIYETPFEDTYKVIGIDEKRALFFHYDSEEKMITVYLLKLEE